MGSTLFARCETFERVRRGEVVCPECGAVFVVSRAGESRCPGKRCAWQTTHASYWKSIQDHYAFTGRAVDAFVTFHERYPDARSYREKIVLIGRPAQPRAGGITPDSRSVRSSVSLMSRSSRNTSPVCTPSAGAARISTRLSDRRSGFPRCATFP